MKRIVRNFLFYLLIVFLLVALSGFIFVLFKGKTLIVAQLSKILKAEVKVAAVRLSPTLTLEIRNLDIPQFAKVERVIVSPVVAGFARGRIVLGKVALVRPRATLSRSPDGSFNVPEGIKEKLREKSKAPTPVLISGLVIKDGEVIFSDEGKSPPFSFKVRNINADIGNKILSFNPFLTRISAAAEIIGKEDAPPAVVSAAGWVNFLKKDMKAALELYDLDAVYFLPLYSNLVASKLQNGIVSFKSDLVAKNNALVANCRLNIKDLVFVKPEEEGAPNLTFLDIVTGGLKTENKEVVVDFVIKTKLDNPKVDLVKLSGSVIGKALGEQMLAHPEETVENFKSIGKDFEKFGKEMLKEQLGIDLERKKEESVDAPAQQQ
ncbi:MAG: DUF748 domain-containing protein [Candidatus Omnitrophota bacterium]